MQARVALSRALFEWGPAINRHGALYRPLAREVAGVCAAWVKRLLASHDRVVFVDGLQFAVGPAPHYAGLEFRFRNYEPGVASVLRRMLGPGMIFVDVGAHVGFHSLAAARLVGDRGRVYAFEPDPDTYDLLQNNARLNRLTNIIAVPLAVDEGCGEKDLFLGVVHEGHNTLYARRLVGSKSVRVETTTLDTYFATRGILRLDVIKLDVQGAEPAVLRGANDILRRCRGLKIIVEIDPIFLRATGSDPEAILEPLLDARYRFWWIARDGALERISGDGLHDRQYGLHYLLGARSDAQV